MIKPYRTGTEVFCDKFNNQIIYEVVSYNYRFENGIDKAIYTIQNRKTHIQHFNIDHFDLTPTLSSLSIDDLLIMHQFYTSMIRTLGDDLEYEQKLIVVEDHLKFKSKIHNKKI